MNPKFGSFIPLAIWTYWLLLWEVVSMADHYILLLPYVYLSVFLPFEPLMQKFQSWGYKFLDWLLLSCLKLLLLADKSFHQPIFHLSILHGMNLWKNLQFFFFYCGHKDFFFQGIRLFSFFFTWVAEIFRIRNVLNMASTFFRIKA